MLGPWHGETFDPHKSNPTALATLTEATAE